MEFSAHQIAGILNGEIVGNPDVSVSGLSKIEEGTEGTLSFLSNPKYEEHIYSTGASICIVNNMHLFFNLIYHFFVFLLASLSPERRRLCWPFKTIMLNVRDC